jgi:hypothetical protein
MKLQKMLDRVDRLQAFSGAEPISRSGWSSLGDEEFDQVFTYPFYFQASVGQVPDLSFFQDGSFVIVALALHATNSLPWLLATQQWGLSLPISNSG